MTTGVADMSEQADRAGRERVVRPRVLVTGGEGLLGREVVAQLAAAGHVVRTLDRLPPRGMPHQRVETRTGNLLEERVCRMACEGVEAIVHTAALQYHSGVPAIGRGWFFSQNITMTRNLIDAALAAGVRRLVMVSSDMVYGLPPGRPLREDDTPQPIGPYGRSKLSCECHCSACTRHGLHVVILRPRLIIGPGRLGVLTRLFERIRRGRPVPLIGDGRNRYQMVAVSDTAAACALAVDSKAEGVFNLGSSDPPPVAELLADLCRRAGSASRLRRLPAGLANFALGSLDLLRVAPLKPEQYRIASVDYVLDTSRARDQLGWQPQFSDPDMLWAAYESYLASRA